MSPIDDTKPFCEEITFNKDGTFTRAKELALNNMYVCKITPRDIPTLKNYIQQFDSIDFTKNNASVRSNSVKLRFNTSETVYGFAVWWDATLIPGIHLSTSPFSPSTHWDQIFLPLIKPVVLKKNDALELTIKSDTRYEVGIRVTWETTILQHGTKRATRIVMHG